MVAPAQSYGQQITIADAATGVLLAGAAVLGTVCFVNTFDLFENTKPDDHPSCSWGLFSLALAGTTFALASPIIHLVHNRPAAALGSFALRAVLPASAFLVAASGAGAASAVAGVVFVGSLVTAMFVDWFVLAVPGEPERHEPHTVAWQPSVLALRGGAGLGVVGRY